MFRPTALLVLLFSLLITHVTFAGSDTNGNQNSDDIKLVLIGIVLDSTEQVRGDVIVQLEDIDTEETQTFTTKEDGQFSFNLKPERTYNVSIIDINGNIIIAKNISTNSKKDPEILHAILNINEITE